MIAAALALSLGAGAATAALRARHRKAQIQVPGYVGGVERLVRVLHVAPGQVMRADAAIAFLRMHAAAAAVGVGLQVNSAWRSMEKQRELYASYVAGAGALASKPGYSNHQGGIAVDIQTGGTGTAVYRWLEQNAARFGFKRTVVSEPWHWEYRPSEVAP